MPEYWIGVVFLNFAVDLPLLVGAGRLCDRTAGLLRPALAALLGAVYAGICLVDDFSFMGHFFWRMISFAIMASIAYGFSAAAVRPGAVFALLRLAMGGVAMGLTVRGIWAALASAVVILCLCVLSAKTKSGSQYIPVELTYNGKKLNLTALQDTGNTLRDPVTGAPVLVVGGEAAQQLTGLTPLQLRDPIRSMGVLPGLRLIPYRAVGTQNGLLLGIRLQDVRIGSWRGSYVVAFAPDTLGEEKPYQALAGGFV